MREIKTPLIYRDAFDIARRVLREANESVEDHYVASALQAVDVASREQERERAAKLVEQDILDASEPIAKTLRRLAAEIRNPEVIPHE